jgi:hypothetical protein
MSNLLNNPFGALKGLFGGATSQSEPASVPEVRPAKKEYNPFDAYKETLSTASPRFEAELSPEAKE